jgi:transcription elongation factor GreA-like protein
MAWSRGNGSAAAAATVDPDNDAWAKTPNESIKSFSAKKFDISDENNDSELQLLLNMVQQNESKSNEMEEAIQGMQQWATEIEKRLKEQTNVMQGIMQRLEGQRVAIEEGQRQQSAAMAQMMINMTAMFSKFEKSRAADDSGSESVASKARKN